MRDDEVQDARREAPDDPASLDALQRVLHRRKLAARVLVLVTAFCLLLGPPAAVFDRRGLAIPLALVWVYVLFLIVDCGHLAGWRRRLLLAWQSGAVNLAVHAGAVTALPTLPRATLAAMLRTLPILTPVEDRDLTSAERAALSTFSDWRWMERTAGALLPGALLALAAGAGGLFIAGWLRFDAISAAVLGLLALALIGLRILLPYRALRRVRRMKRALPASGRARLVDLARSLDWTDVPASQQAAFLRALETTGSAGQ